MSHPSYASAIHKPTGERWQLSSRTTGHELRRTEAELLIAHQNHLDAQAERQARQAERREAALARFDAALQRDVDFAAMDRVMEECGANLILSIVMCDHQDDRVKALTMESLRRWVGDAVMKLNLAPEPVATPEPAWVAQADDEYHAAVEDAKGDAKRWDIIDQ